MIPRYSRPEMARIWEAENRFEKMLKVELLACQAMMRQGKISRRDFFLLKTRAKIDVKEIEKIEKTVKHEVIAFLTQIERRVGPAARVLHLGLTSSDVLDTALAVQLKEATEILQKNLAQLSQTVASLAKKYKNTLMMGRTHGVHAEPITFGLKVAGWYSELKRDQLRLRQAKENIAFGKISGAVGTYAHLSPQVEKFVCQKLGLKVEPHSTQIVPRDRYAEYLCTLSLVGASLERFATEIRHLQRTEVLEVEEPFSEGQRGSSAMPHKRNPIACENICGLARLLRAYAQAGMENIALWHERDISHSSVERVVLPDATILLDFMLQRMNEVLKGLVVYPERMQENMKNTVALIASQRLMLQLLEKSNGKLSREQAYKIVQSLAQRAWKGTPPSLQKGENFKNLVLRNSEIRKFLDAHSIESCFDLEIFTRQIATIFKRLGL